MSEILFKSRFHATAAIAIRRFVFLASMLCLAGITAFAQINVAVFGNNTSVLNLLNNSPSTMATLVTNADIELSGLSSYDVFLYTRELGALHAQALSPAAAIEVQAFASGTSILFLTNFADKVGPGAAGDEDLLASAIMLNAVTLAGAGGNGFVGEFEGAGAALQSNGSGELGGLALGLVPGTFTAVTFPTPPGWDILQPASAVFGGPVPNPLTFGGPSTGQEFLVNTTGVPSASIVADGPGASQFPTIVVHVPVGDDEGPITSNLQSNPVSPILVNETFTVTAAVDDSTAGNSNVASAACTLTNKSTDPPSVIPCGPMTASDGFFDSPTEDVEKTFIAGTLGTGVYDLCVNGTDSLGNVGADTCAYLVIYDPDGPFVTGGGWILSPPGAYTANPLLTGKANFGFLAKYKKNGKSEPATPDGQTRFEFKIGNLEFESSAYDWLVITGPGAQFRGVGTVNGEGNFGFFISAKDGDFSNGSGEDTFRIKIWDNDNGGGPIYDNGSNQEIGGGNIKVHK